jgi:hypothetical protein
VVPVTAGGLAVAAREALHAGSELEFELLYLDPDDGGGPRVREKRCPLAVGWSTRFERAAPVRRFPSFRGQRHFPGAWWSATSGELVGFESWLERDQIMLLDFDPHVVAFAAQPFRLVWWQQDGRRRRHAPDLFARLADGTGVVIDVRADDRIGPQDADAFAATARACSSVGWGYRRVGAVDPALAANLRWPAGYRHPRCRDDRRAVALRNAFSSPAPLLQTIDRIGDRIAVLPTAFHLLWTGVLTTDLTDSPLNGSTLVTSGVRR